MPQRTRPTRPDPKVEALRVDGAFNRHADQVTDPLFAGHALAKQKRADDCPPLPSDGRGVRGEGQTKNTLSNIEMRPIGEQGESKGLRAEMNLVFCFGV